MRVQRLGTAHMVLNLTIVGRYLVNLALRAVWMMTGGIPIALSLLGVCGLGVSGWLGGEMVFVHRVGVAEHREAPKRGSRRVA